MELKFITGNENKFREVKNVISKVKMLTLDLPEIQSLNSEEIIEEKLIRAAVISPTDSFIVDDTSFTLDKIGLPGTLIKFFLETIGDEGIYKFAKSFDAMNATITNKIGFYNSENQSFKYFEGEVKGKVVSPRGRSFGFDTIFVPKGYEKSFAEDLRLKSKISHRMIAINKLKKYLNKIKFFKKH